MAYPAAYRSSRARVLAGGGGSFQSPTPWKRLQESLPANDNVPRPANDNLPKPPKLPAPKAALARKLGFRIAGKVATRFIPIVGWGLLAYDLYKGLQWLREQTNTGTAGWTTGYGPCGNIAVGPSAVTQSTCNFNGVYARASFAAGLAAKHQVISGVAPNRTFRVTYFDVDTTPLNVSFASHRSRYRATIHESVWDGSTYPYQQTDNTWARPAHDPFARPIPYLPPNMLPIGQPSPLVGPMPYRAIPHQPQNQFYESGPRNVPRPQPRPERKRPGPRVKERKSRTRVAAAVIQKMGHTATEALDVLQAFYNALPRSVRKKLGSNPSPQEMAKAVYDNYEQIDMSDLLFELLWNHFGDQVIGRLGGNMDRVGNDRGVKWGPYGQGDPGPLMGAAKKWLKQEWSNGVDHFSPSFDDLTAGEVIAGFQKQITFRS